MKNIKFEITEQDIRKYIEKYKNYYRYCEPLFIKYLKDNRFNLTEEMFEIITEGKLLFYNNGELSSFNSFPNTVQNLDLSGICHILIPTIRYYDRNISSVSIGRIYDDLDKVSETLNVPMNNSWETLESTIDDYIICDKIQKNDEMITFKLGREHSRKELITYSHFYNESKVMKIRKLIREGIK